MRHKSTKYVIGIDEAGRGPLAGPVAVAAIRVSRPLLPKSNFRSLKDSKKLSAKQREKWFSVLTNHPKIEWAVAKVWPRVIDRINITRAANLGAGRAYARLCRAKQSIGGKKLSLARETALLDGGLKLPAYIPHATIIKGDEKIPAIAAASIIAKVTRDRTMVRLHKKFPQYRFDLHKGYGTALHAQLLRKFGRSPAHRRSFRTPA